ncbi:hypothetical protein IEQ34_011912 [Dendrobium chrysotoxum]|uniref:Uncharacterized protein n=1 Tax=Dendrobium chrysotoxum TaxID=161865 RepID=A0AAV7GTN8_DENCH|nr:hypothetical protein IEQ34_011912 [Dendrobium chrysotoxum]
MIQQKILPSSPRSFAASTSPTNLLPKRSSSPSRLPKQDEAVDSTGDQTSGGTSPRISPKASPNLTRWSRARALRSGRGLSLRNKTPSSPVGEISPLISSDSSDSEEDTAVTPRADGKPIYMVSDGTGWTAEHSVNAALGQFEHCLVDRGCPINTQLFSGGRELHVKIREAGLDRNPVLLLKLLKFYCVCGRADDVREVFDSIPKRNLDTFAWTTMIIGYVRNETPHQEIKLFCEMLEHGLELDSYTFSASRKVSTDLSLRLLSTNLHSLIMNCGFGSFLSVGNALIHAYGSFGDACSAQVFDVEILMKLLMFSVVWRNQMFFLWTSMMEVFSINERFELALELFKEMQGHGLKLNPFALIVVLSDCNHGGLVDLGLEIFESMKERFGFEPCVEHYACIVDMLGRGGRLNEAENLIERMEVPPTGSVLGSLHGACQVHCNVKLGEKLAMMLFRLEPYNETNYVEDVDRLMEIIKQAAKEGALVLYTLADPSMAESAKQACKLWGVPSADILRPTIEAIAAHIGVAPSGIPRGAPGRNPLTEDYFKRIEAIEFTIKQDDGALPQNLNRAHIVLVGVSRTGKTPLSIYLAQKGYKVANVPIVIGVDSPKSLFDINQEKIFGLTINPAVLQTIRKARAKTLGLKGDMMSNYSDMEHVREELEFAKRIFAQNPIWPVIEITGKAIEETAAVIVRIYHDRKKKCFLPRISKRY